MWSRCVPVTRAVLVAALAVAVLSSDVNAREFRRRRKFNSVNDSPGTGGQSSQATSDPIAIPDTGKIDSEFLKTVAADKFLSLWFIFVLAGPTKNTNEPWTLFVPLNSGLPGPGTAGFLSDSAATRRLLLNHAVLGTAFDASQLGSATTATTMAGSELTFSTQNGEHFVNGIRVTGENIPVAGGSVIIIENSIPVTADQSNLDTKPKRRRIKQLKLDDEKESETIAETNAPVQVPTTTEYPTTTTEAPTSTSAKKSVQIPSRNVTRPNTRPSPFLVKKRKNERDSTAGNVLNTGNKLLRSTRFEKFKKSEAVATDSPQSENVFSTKQIPLSKSFSPTETPTFTTETPQPTREPHIITGELATETLLTPIIATEHDTTSTTQIADLTTQSKPISTTSPAPTTTTVSFTTTTTTTEGPSTPDIFAFFTSAGESTTPSNNISDDVFEIYTDLALLQPEETETEAPFLAFDTFVKTTSNGEKYFPNLGSSDLGNKTVELEFVNTTENIELGEADEIEFLADSDFVPFNEFLNSQTATEKFNEAFEMLPEGGIVVSNTSEGDTTSTNFLKWLKTEVKTRQQLGGKEFLHHLLDSGVYLELAADKQYTALIPTDEAFYAYYPIDWGFNPFLVESFLRRTLLEHLLEGDVALEDLPEGAQLTTLAGTTLTLHKNEAGTVTVAGQRVLTESEVVGPQGRIYSLPALLHVTPSTVEMLRTMNRHLERAPLLGSPWPMSQFLSHLLQRLRQEKPYTGQGGTRLFAHYLSQSDIAHLATSSDDFKRMEYTALVPSDASIVAAINPGGSAPVDPYLEDVEARNRLVGSHIIKGRYAIADLTPGTVLTTLLNDTLTTSADADGNVMVGGATLLPPGESIYNLGTMFIVNGPLELGENEPTTEPAPVVARGARLVVQPTPSIAPRVVTRTEVSVSRQINNGAIERVPASIAQLLARRLL